MIADVTGGGFIALWSVLYLVLLVTLGIMSIRKGHWVMFLIGLISPPFLADRRLTAVPTALGASLDGAEAAASMRTAWTCRPDTCDPDECRAWGLGRT